MAYTKQTWANDTAGGTPLSAPRLTHIEDGIAAAQDAADAAAAASVSIARLPAGATLTVLKDATTGFWPASYTATGAPVYTGGSASAGVRPTTRTDIVVAWKGADPDPGIVSSGTGGMLNGVDYRLVTP